MSCRPDRSRSERTLLEERTSRQLEEAALDCAARLETMKDRETPRIRVASRTRPEASQCRPKPRWRGTAV